MDDKLVYVSPERLYLSHVSKSDSGWTSIQPKVGYIPILKANLERFRTEQLNNLTKQGGQIDVAKESAGVENNRDGGAGGSATQKIERKYRPVTQFTPSTLEDQLFMVTIVLKEEMNPSRSKALKGVNLDEATKTNIIEEFLRRAIPSYEEVVVSWTVSELSKGEHDETVIFVRFCPAKTSEFVSVVKQFSKAKNLEVHYDENTKRYINDQDTIQVQDTQVDTRNYGKLMEECVGGVQKTETMVEETDYQIDYNTLMDIPREALDQLSKEIIEFRTKVISIEKEKQVRQQYEDNERRRKHMAQLFNKLLKTKHDDDIDEEEEDDDVADEEEEGHDEEEYREMLGVWKELGPRLKRLGRRMDGARRYESDLAERHAENLRNLQRQGQDGYYGRRARDAEEIRDAEDREMHPEVVVEGAAGTGTGRGAEKEKTKAAEKESIKINFKKAMATEGQSEAVEERYGALREHRVVEELVREYLGVVDDEVVAFVYEILEGDSCDEEKQRRLAQELEDLFDEEAAEFSARLFSKM
ncbi:Snu71p RNJ42_00733 [Nakaseomyces bracarensis]|uniref:Snu71p n=1 Tax=Nakaseomyces bracarensis TaxID=273131 RepID=UPI0038723931